MLEDSVAKLIEANKTETDSGQIEDNLRYIAIGQEKLARLGS
ncbi:MULTISPECIES: hypothetical protein [Roseovarius]|nr:hypothetical protein [Roseovarius atlanticus]